MLVAYDAGAVSMLDVLHLLAANSNYAINQMCLKTFSTSARDRGAWKCTHTFSES